MGLDMYLYAKKDFYNVDTNKKSIDSIKKALPEMKEFELNTIQFEVAYWRKANHIHKWFCDNCDINDDNNDKEIYIETEKLVKLLEVCNKVMNNKELAGQLLPTTNGFFFGSTDYDDYYFDQIQHTIDILNKIIKILTINKVNGTNDGYEFYYYASW